MFWGASTTLEIAIDIPVIKICTSTTLELQNTIGEFMPITSKCQQQRICNVAIDAIEFFFPKKKKIIIINKIEKEKDY